MSVLNSLVSRIEDRLYKDQIAATRVQQPVFVVGHWRSGTTLLHNLLACDPQVATPTLFQTLYPDAFMVLKRPFRYFAKLVPRTRLIDNVRFGFEQPQEDEFALCNATLLSPYVGWIFPHDQAYYDRYLTLQTVTIQEQNVWRQALVRFLRKVTWYTGRYLVLKSPTHTARIRLLLEMFPDARFVYICRHPYAVFQSTQHLHQVMFRTTSLERTDDINLVELVLRRYQVLLDSYLSNKCAIAPGHLCEIRFEELEQDPLRMMGRIYAELGLPGFAEARPHFVKHLACVNKYHKNQYAPLSVGLRNEINHRWNRTFEEWGYKP
jgi:hypothetical protein